MSFIVVSYHTPDVLYEESSIKFVKSLERFHIPYYIERIESLGDWWRNTAHKPTFLKAMLKKFPESNVVWVDCDAEFMAYPELFDVLDYDTIAAHEFDRSCYKRGLGKEVLSGTLFLRNNETTFRLVEDWEKECQKHLYRWEQKSLEAVLNGHFYRLPIEYCKIWDCNRRVDNPVIVHYQNSRILRKSKGGLKRRTGSVRGSFPKVSPTHNATTLPII